MKDNRLYLLHIRDACVHIMQYIPATQAEFMDDIKTQDAVIRNLQVIGEAVKRLSPDFRKQQPEIPWQDIAGMRDKLVHDYFSVNLSMVWDTIWLKIPVLKEQVNLLIEQLGGENLR